MKFSKEIELIDLFCEYLDKRGCKYKRELRKRSYHNDGYIDIVIRIGYTFIAIEGKLNGFQSVFYQATGNLISCNYSYILYPRIPRSKLVNDLKKNTIGLIIFNPETNNFEISVRAKKSKYLSKYTTIIIKRNWDENRCGRVFTKRELPLGYPAKKLEALKPTYEWVRTNKEIKRNLLEKKHKTLDKFN